MSNDECDRLRNTLRGQYEMMLKGEHCDFRIAVEGRVLSVHKMVLASRSPYFRTLFSSRMTESEENLLKLDDIELDIFQLLLEYVYTCDFASLNTEEAFKLIMHGEKYGLKDLVDHCEAHLLENINIEIAARCLLAGDLLKRERLKLKAMSLLCRNWKFAFYSDVWNDVTSNHELMTAIEKFECPRRKLRPIPSGRMTEIPNNDKVKWVFPFSSLQDHTFIESQAFSLSGDDDLSWRFRARISKRIDFNTVLLYHFGPPVINPVTFIATVSKNDEHGRKVKLWTGTIDTSCCFLQHPSCLMVLTSYSRPTPPSESDFITVTVKRCPENIPEAPMDYLSEYLEKSCFTDAIIKVGAEEFSVHKIILSIASPIFREKFQNQGSVIELDDQIDPETFRTLLLIIYQSPDIPPSVNFDLLKAAKLYKISNKQINRYKAAVFRAMKDSQLIDFLIQARALQDPVMRRLAFKQMARDFSSIVQSDDWNLMSKHSDLHDEFFRFVVARNIH